MTQKEIDKIWRKEWVNLRDFDLENLFNHRLFVEGHPIFKMYIPENAKDILDAGGGTGRHGLMIAKNFPKSSVTISDILDESLYIGKNFATKINIKNVQFEKDDILNSHFQNGLFDVVFSDVVIQHLSEYKKAIKEIVRITKPGGTMIIAVNNWWNLPHTIYKFTKGKNYEYGYEKSFTKKELRKLLENEGVKILAEDGFYAGYGIFRLKKYHRTFHFLGRLVNRLSMILDKFTNRFFSRNFGFEIVIVGRKR